MATSLIVYAEIYDGIIGDIRAEQRLADLNRLLMAVPVVPPDRQTAQVFARLRADLRVRGEPSADHDLWIAATALQHGLTLVSRDHHFDRIPNLKRA